MIHLFVISVAKLTGKIRCLQSTMEQFPRNVHAKVSVALILMYHIFIFYLRARALQILE